MDQFKNTYAIIKLIIKSTCYMEVKNKHTIMGKIKIKPICDGQIRKQGNHGQLEIQTTK